MYRNVSSWNTVTLNFSNDRRKEGVDEQLREEYDSTNPPTATGYGDATVRVRLNKNHQEVAEQFSEQFPDATHVVVLSVSNTTEDATGTLFEVNEDGSLEQIEKVEGYNGARARSI